MPLNTSLPIRNAPEWIRFFSPEFRSGEAATTLRLGVSMAEMLADGLNERGFDAVALASSGEAATRLGENSFDALVTDLRMPDVDGLELLKISRVSAPGRPVIVMTACSALESAIESIRQGASHYLTKPFKLDELVLFLNRALDDSRLRREAVHRGVSRSE